MEEGQRERRSFLSIAILSMVGIGVALAGWPLIAHMNPIQTRLSNIFFDVFLGDLKEGEEIRVLYQGDPIIIRHRSAEQIRTTQSVKLDELYIPVTDQSRLFPMEDGTYNFKYIVLIGREPFYGRYPVIKGGSYGGWYGTQRGSHFDVSGRLRKGAANGNMAVPPYSYKSKDVISLHPYRDYPEIYKIRN